MPQRAPRPCPRPRCVALITSADPYCPEHMKERRDAYNRKRPERHRFYGTAVWQRLRNRHIRRNPICVMCEAEGAPAIGHVVDHIEPIEHGGGKLDPDNLQTLCNAHHARKTAQDHKRGQN